MPDTVGLMLASLRHRGPDDQGIFSTPEAVIGVRRLSIIDLTGGHQPMQNEQGTVTAVLNGEIYNFLDLREQLRSAGHIFASDSDTEVLPHGYEEWGPSVVSRLRGMFAVAIWDAERQRLFLARDRFGKKPLFYVQSGGTLAFASELQALRIFDDAAINEYLTFGFIAAPRTAFDGVFKVPPAHSLTFDGASAHVQRYWQLTYSPKLQIGRVEAEAELRRRIEDAVRVRLMSDVPLGAFLSGGLDSSTVVAYMARNSRGPVKTFSIGFRDAVFDELGYARIVANAFGTDHHELIVDAEHVDALPMLVRHLGEPFADSSIVPTFQVSRQTRGHVTVALNGDGGDETFGGYDRYRAASAAAALTRVVPGPALRFLAEGVRRLPMAESRPRIVRRVARFTTALGTPVQDRYLGWGGYFFGDQRRRIVGERLRAIAAPTAARRLEQAARLGRTTDPAETFMAADTFSYLPDDLLVKVDIASMACSLEARSPLLDHELAEFVAVLPVTYKLSPLRSKILLRSAMRGVVPDAILDRRRKMGFSAPVADWLRKPLRPLLADVMSHSVAVKEGFIDEAGFKALVGEHLDRDVDRSMLIWNVLMLELWFREVVRSD